MLFANKPENGTSLVFPSFQISLIDYRAEEKLISQLLNYIFTADPLLQFELTFATGYFNPSDSLFTQLLKIPNNVHLKIMTAGPSANSFFRAKGVKGLVPSMYRCVLSQWINAFSKHNNVQFYEFQKPGATYHGKGVWLKCLNNPQTEYLTIYGSSNYSNRSYQRDLESQFYLVTNDPDKIALFEQEREDLMRHCHIVTAEIIAADRETRVNWWQKLGLKMFKSCL